MENSASSSKKLWVISAAVLAAVALVVIIGLTMRRDDGWKTYRDRKNHYSFRYPSMVNDMRGCPGDWKGTVPLIPLIVLKNGNTSYLTTEKIAVWSGEFDCDHMPATPARITYKNFAFISDDAKNDDEINAFLRREYGNGCRMAAKIPDPVDPSTFHIELSGSEPDAPEDELCFINYGTEVRYSEKWGTIVKWDIGQDFNFVDDTQKDAQGLGHIYDGEISESFRFE